MTPAQLNLLLKADQSLGAAKFILDGGYPDYAASRAYYAMFYIADDSESRVFPLFFPDKECNILKTWVVSNERSAPPSLSQFN